MNRLILFFALLAGYFTGYSQCCSGGVPMAGNIGMPVADANTLQISASVDHNSLQTYLTGTEKVVEFPKRERNTTTYIFETSYAFNKLLSVDVLLPYVVQQRKVGFSELISSGIGDMAVLPKFTFFNNLTLGVGVKLPTGSDEQMNNGVSLLIDMQPGSGAWDALYHFSYVVPQAPFLKTLSSFVTINVRNTGTNKNYLVQDNTYRFGREIQAIVGTSNRFTLFKKHIADLSLKFRYRQAQKDSSSGITPLSSGGEWVFVNPGLSYLLSPSVSIQGNFELPLYQSVEGIQLSPTFRFNSGIFITLKKQKNDNL